MFLMNTWMADAQITTETPNRNETHQGLSNFAHLTSCSLNNSLHILQSLLCLCLNSAWHDLSGLWIERNRPRNKKKVTDFKGLGVGSYGGWRICACIYRLER